MDVAAAGIEDPPEHSGMDMAALVFLVLDIAERKFFCCLVSAIVLLLRIPL